MDQTCPVTLKRNGNSERLEEDHVAAEEPLEIIVDGHPIAVLMRTPGHDEDLVAGFLITEGIIRKRGQLRKVECLPDENRALAFLADDIELDPGKLTRHFYTSSSCGLCGKATLDAVFIHSEPVEGQLRIADEVILSAPGKLRESQQAFSTTGGLHAAGIFSPEGELLISREDIGRHNAVDKVIGRATYEEVDLTNTFLIVSGRVSFEIMQKSLIARIPVIAAVSAPSSLAVDFAKRSGQTLIGFLRPPDYNLYT